MSENVQPKSEKMKCENSEACGSNKLLCYEQNDTVKMSIEWTLTDLPDVFHFLKTSKKAIKSKKCIVPGKEEEWMLIALDVSEQNCEWFLNVGGIYASSPDGHQYASNCNIGIIYSSNPCVKEMTPQTMLFTSKHKCFATSVRFSRLLSENSLMTKDDQLVICCQLNYCRTSHGSSLFLETPVCLELQEAGGLNKDLMDLYSTMNLSDVSFKFLNGVELFGHRLILGARSPVFAAMFASNMKEKHVDYVEIQDIDSEAFQDFLRFCYTDKLIESEAMAKLLLPVADKYLVEQLKKKCENVLISKLSVQNCSELLALSDRHSAEKLKTAAMTFSHKFAPEIILTSGWKELKKVSPALCSDVLEFTVLSKE